MENSSFLLLSRQLTAWDNLENVTNNIAHTDDTGFKKDMMIYHHRITKDINPKTLYFPQAILTIPDLSPGSIYTTNNALDLALEDNIGYVNFFMIRDENGDIKYTKNGHFHTDNIFRIVDVKNHPVLSQDGDEIILDPQDSELVVMKDGTILTSNGERGIIGVASFADSECKLIQKDDEGYFTNNILAVNNNDNYQIIQGALESSNADTIAGMGDLAKIQHEVALTAKLQDDLYNLRRKTYEYFSTVSGG